MLARHLAASLPQFRLGKATALRSVVPLFTQTQLKQTDPQPDAQALNWHFPGNGNATKCLLACHIHEDKVTYAIQYLIYMN